MTDAEISRRLALAIGYEKSLVYTTTKKAVVWHHAGPKNDGLGWYSFDYRAPAVIWPIAERFDCFPERRFGNDLWIIEMWKPYMATLADTAAKAVALAVIKAKEQQ